MSVCHPAGSSGRYFGSGGAGSSVALGGVAGFVACGVGGNMRMVSMFSVGTSGVFGWVPKGLLGVVLNCWTMRISRNWANMVLISSNCARRCHSCARVASDGVASCVVIAGGAGLIWLGRCVWVGGQMFWNVGGCGRLSRVVLAQASCLL